MSILQKDFIYEVIPGELITTSTPGIPATDGYWTTIPPEPVATITASTTDTTVTTSAIRETLGYVRIATWAEVKGIWPWLTTECDIQIKILTALRTSPNLGSTIFAQYSYRKEDQPLDGGPLLMYTMYIAIQRINGGVAFCAVNGKDYIVVETNPLYVAGYTYGGEISGC